MDDTTNIQKIDLDKVDWRGSREFFESLGEALDKLNDKDESYDFTWVGKRKSIIEAGVPINKTFRPDVENSKNWDTTENLFIEGDNLDALKLLQESYLGKVKMIYIDPPYNTGKDFVYHDNFKANVEEYDEAIEYKDESGNIQFKKNEKSNGRYHSDWLSMMYPRLKLAKNLLTEDGVIFISIDDNEQSNLKMISDELFGENNVEMMVWKKVENDSGKLKITYRFRTEHEYILVCYRNKEKTFFKKFLSERNYKNVYNNPDNDPRGEYKQGIISTTEEKSVIEGKNYYKVVTPSGKEFMRQWRCDKDEFQRLRDDGRIYFGKNGDSVPSLKVFINELGETTPASVLEGYGTAKSAGLDLIGLFGGENKYFDYPKPISLIKHLIFISSGTDSIILDFFAGSATTAHSVIQLNAEDEGNRKWIMVQLPEQTDESSEAFKVGYKTIPDIARERVRRAGDKMATESPQAKVDYGFRSLTITDTNYKDVYKSASKTTQSSLLETVNNIKEDRSELDLLYGVLTATALELNRPLETRNISGSTVYLYDYFSEVSGLVACFAGSIGEDVIKEIAKLKPLTAVFRDSSFPDSQAKVNLSEHFRILSPETKVKVI